jgi:MoxR-like ATPase
VLEIQETVRTIHIDESVIDYAIQIVERTRRSEFLSLGVSPRGSLALLRACQSRAYVQGRDYCLPEDVKRLAAPVLAHRVVVNQRAASTLRRNEEAEKVLQDILDSVEVPL